MKMRIAGRTQATVRGGALKSVVESADSCTSETWLEQYFRACLTLSTFTLKLSEPV